MNGRPTADGLLDALRPIVAELVAEELERRERERQPIEWSGLIRFVFLWNRPCAKSNFENIAHVSIADRRLGESSLCSR